MRERDSLIDYLSGVIARAKSNGAKQICMPLSDATAIVERLEHYKVHADDLRSLCIRRAKS